MIGRRSPPEHRHDGTSPLPLSMDWSPPPKNWNGCDTIWPHDPQTGWSYCVTIPSWFAVPKSRAGASDPVVFYRVLVGIQSPDGVTTTRGVLRRFNDFLKLFSDLRKAFPKKCLLFAPPKGLTRLKSRELLEERRCSLEEWMLKLLSDINISRSMVVASFLELEPAVRSSLREATQQPSEANLSTSGDISSYQIHRTPSISTLGGSSSIASDYGSDTAYESSELGSPSLGRDDSSEVGLEELTLDGDFTNPMDNLVSMSNIDEGLLMGKNILDQIEGFRKHKIHPQNIIDNGNMSKPIPLAVNSVGSFFEGDHGKVENYTQKLSNESIESDSSSCKGSEMSNSWAPNMLGEASLDLPGGSKTMMIPGGSEPQFHNGGQITLPRDEQPKLDRVLMTMQRRLLTAKTDMEDLLTRLNQETAVKEYLTTKVKDLEGELESTKEKSKENLQQALSLEKERITKMQWDMEELRRKSLEMELKLNSQEDCKRLPESTSSYTVHGKDELLMELEATKGKLNSLLEQHAEVEVKSKSDIKILVKEVKFLRRSQCELKQKLEESLQEKTEMKQLLQHAMERSEHALASRRQLLRDCQSLQCRLRDCNVKFVDSNFDADSSSLSDISELLAESEKRITLLLTETDEFIRVVSNNDEMKTVDNELRLILRDIFVDNARLRKQINHFIQFEIDRTPDDGKHKLSSVLKQLYKHGS